MKFSKNVNNNKDAPKLIFFNEKKIKKDSDNFWHRKLTLKVRNKDFQSPPAKRTLICQKKILWKSAIFHSIKLPFDAEVAEKILNGIYSTTTWTELTCVDSFYTLSMDKKRHFWPPPPSSFPHSYWMAP